MKRSLYDELAAVGRREKSIQPSAFVTADGLPKYEKILRCAEVRRRAKGDANATELSLHAHQAIQDVIATIYIPTDRLVAEVALCATDEYEGLTVKERTNLLLDEGITPDIYKRHRRAALRHIVTFLNREDQNAIELSHDVNQDHLKNRLQELAQAAANFHVAGLLTRLVTSPSIKTHPTGLSGLRSYQVGEPAEYLLHTYAELLRTLKDGLFTYPVWKPRIIDLHDEGYNPTPIGVPVPSILQQEPYQQVKERFDKALLHFYQLEKLLSFLPCQALLNILRTILEYDPFRDTDHFYVTYYTPKPFEIPREYADIQVDRIYSYIWKPWHEANASDGPIRDRSEVKPSSLAVLCAKSGAVSLIIAKHLDGFKAVMGQAAKMAVRALPYYYGVYGSIMLDDGTKLNDTKYAPIAERYFSKVGAELAKSFLATYGSNDYGVLEQC